jgi:predicted  nucleic acid-binding Zn-ribbon protein
MSKPGSPPSQEDLEATAELPAVDFAPMDRDLDKTVITDLFSAPDIAESPAVADNLREMELQLVRERARLQAMEARLAAASEREAVLQVQLAAAMEQRFGLEAKLATAGERQLVLQSQLADANEQYADIESKLANAAANYAALEMRLVEADTRYEAVGVQLQARPVAEPMAAAVPRESADLAELRRCSARQLEALGTWYGFRSLSDSLLAEVEARNLQLEEQVATMSEALRTLERKRAAAPPVLQPVPQRDGENQALKSELAALKAEFGELQAVLSGLRERQQRAEQHAEAESVRARRLEDEAQDKTSLRPPPRNNERPAIGNSGRYAAAPAVRREGPERALVRLHGGAEIVYAIGRRTTIGRMPDNDIQLDTTNVSRHHAVLLCNADHCIVEDLNSTNGVLVNGQRVGRQLLHDGDIVAVGKTEFRFQYRP